MLAMDTPGTRPLTESEFRKARTALRVFKSELAELYSENAPEIRIYGSFARGQPNSASDIDVLLLFPKEIHPGEEIRRVNWILADLNLRFQVLISVLPANKNELKSSSTPFWENVRRESVSIESI
jgi:predicted nucleotidyltransferase